MPEPAPLWTPSPQRIADSQMHAFLCSSAAQFGFHADWDSLWRWSVERPAEFWEQMLRFAQIQLAAPARCAMSGDGMLGTRWFDGATLNYASHLLRRSDDGPAIIAEREAGPPVRLSWRELRDEVSRCAAALRRAGVARGDRVAGYMPNVPETIIAMLAAASLGAIWSSCSPDFGPSAVLDRFGQIEPKVLFLCDRYFYGGKEITTLERVADLMPQLPSVQTVVVVPYPNHPAGNPHIEDFYDEVIARPAWRGRNPHTWRSFLDERSYPAITLREFPPPPPAPELRFELVPFDHPLYILYSSGTTGVPKCIVHGHGGALLQHMKELMLHTDLRPDDRLFYFTTCGWMMWNWLVSGLGAGATIVLYDGNPAYPSADRLWEMAEQNRVTAFGTSPKFLAACQKSGLAPGRQHDLTALRTILSTGSPLSEELFEWVYREIKADLQLSSISGGTDIVSCFMLGNPLLPVFPGEIQCRGLGMDVHAWDERCRPVVGQKGELVCVTPFPSQPVRFWNDADGRKYRGAYFDFYTPQQLAEAGRPASGPVWRHGDYVEITPRGGVIVYGRSDATLNPGGVRIGTAEIYRIVESQPEVIDSIVVGRDTPDHDVEVCLFVVMRPGLSLTPELEKRLRTTIAAGASKRHVPRHIRQVSGIPHTISGKKVELAVQQVLHGREVRNRDALANPQVLDEFRAPL